MKIIVTGSRTWTDRDKIRARLTLLPPGSTVVHGHSKGGGADLLADQVAREIGHAVIRVPVEEQDYRLAERYNGRRRAGPIFRNLRMLDQHPDAERVEAFWDGVSPGTGHMIGEAQRRGLPVVITEP